LTIAKRKMSSFSVRSYFSEYWVKVYPLLWATSSEALATPLNLYMVKKFCPNVRNEVRQFVVGTGSFLNINGTVINVFLMTGLVAAILGVDVSVLQLLLLIPIVFLIAYGIPGIPGELVIFGGPIALSLGMTPEVTAIFLALYIGLQIGLPDSFRTAANSTDECLSAIILNDKYKA
jgi:Na+/H+-dicarboxylate symporter